MVLLTNSRKIFLTLVVGVLVTFSFSVHSADAMPIEHRVIGAIETRNFTSDQLWGFVAQISQRITPETEEEDLQAMVLLARAIITPSEHLRLNKRHKS